MKPETRLRTKVMPLLKKIPNSWWESIQQKAIVGSPDVLGCINGIFIAIEFKSEKGILSKLQVKKLQDIERAGGKSFVIYPDNYLEIVSMLNLQQTVYSA
jgi:hypothetical protein